MFVQFEGMRYVSEREVEIESDFPFGLFDLFPRGVRCFEISKYPEVARKFASELFRHFAAENFADFDAHWGQSEVRYSQGELADVALRSVHFEPDLGPGDPENPNFHFSENFACCLHLGV